MACSTSIIADPPRKPLTAFTIPDGFPEKSNAESRRSAYCIVTATRESASVPEPMREMDSKPCTAVEIAYDSGTSAAIGITNVHGIFIEPSRILATPHRSAPTRSTAVTKITFPCATPTHASGTKKIGRSAKSPTRSHLAIESMRSDTVISNYVGWYHKIHKLALRWGCVLHKSRNARQFAWLECKSE